jgi:homoserine O-acetyltransferase
MPAFPPPDSAGLVTPQSMDVSEPLALDCGAVINSYTPALVTDGELNAARTNAILDCHALYRFRRRNKQD